MSVRTLQSMHGHQIRCLPGIYLELRRSFCGSVCLAAGRIKSFQVIWCRYRVDDIKLDTINRLHDTVHTTKSYNYKL